MIVALSLSLLLSPACSPSLPLATLLSAQDPGLDAKIGAAGKDVKLLELAAASSKAGAEEDARKVYRKVLELDANNEARAQGAAPPVPRQVVRELRRALRSTSARKRRA